MTDTVSIITQIIALEWRMFQKVKSLAPAVCQQNPIGFKTIRAGIFQLWPPEMLEAYLKELMAADAAGRNLLTEKYARMDGLIEPITTNPRIDKIAKIEAAWQAELKSAYPMLYDKTCRKTDPSDDGSNFSVYLKCELETYGDQVIDMYYAWVAEATEKGENLSMTMLEKLVQKGGFSSLNQAEQYFIERAQQPTRKERRETCN